MIDPVTLGVLTAAVTTLASEVGKGAMGEAGKELWARVKEAFEWVAEPEADALPTEVAKALVASPELRDRVAALLKESPEAGAAGRVVIHAEKVGIAVDHGQVIQNL